MTPARVQDDLQQLLGGPFVRITHGRNSYHEGAVGPGGAALYWTAGRNECLVVLPGEACELLGQTATLSAVSLLDLRVTRLDLAWDIEGVSVRQVEGAFKRGDVVGRVHRDSHEARENAEGHTFYIGSRQSPRYIRFYDRRGPTRLELEVKGIRAQRLVELLMANSEDDWSRLGIGQVRDFCDFRKRTEGDRPEEAPPLRWWVAIITGAERLSITIPGRAPSLERTTSWLYKAVAPTLALWLEASDTADVGELILAGRANWTPRHHALMARVLHSAPAA